MNYKLTLGICATILLIIPFITAQPANTTFYYLLDETVGSIANDESGNNLNANHNGDITIGLPGKNDTFTYSYLFGSALSSLILPHDPLLDFGTGNVTIAFFINGTSTPGAVADNHYIFDTSINAGDQQGMYASLDDSADITFQTLKTGALSTGLTHTFCNGDYESGWKQIVIRRSENGTISIVEDDYQCETASTGTVRNITSGDDFTIGSRWNDRSMEAYLDVFVVSPTYWNDTEINDHYGAYGGIVSSTNFTVKATDQYLGTALTNLTVDISGDAVYSTESSTVATGLFLNDTNEYNITITSNNSGGYFQINLTNYNISNSGSYTALMHQAELIITSLDTSNNATLQSFTLNINTSNSIFSDTSGVIRLNITRGDHTLNLSKNAYISNISNFTFAPLSVQSLQINLTPLNVGLFECGGSYTTKSLNFSIFNENTLGSQAANVDVNFLTKKGSLDFGNYSYSLNGSSNYTFCIDPTGINATVDAHISYDADGFAPRTYFLNNFTIRDTVQQVYLYLLPESNSTNIIFVITDKLTDQPIDNTFLTIERYYPGENLYRSVEISEADVNGNALGHLIIYNTDYRLRVTQYSTPRQTFGPFRITQTPYYLKINPLNDPQETLQKVNDLVYSLTYNNMSKRFRYEWQDTRNVVNQACLEVKQLKYKGTNTVCDTCTSASSGVLYCIVNESTGTYQAEASIDTNTGASYYVIDSLTETFEETFRVFGPQNIGPFVTFSLVGIMSFIGLTIAGSGATIALIFGIFAFAAAGFMSFVDVPYPVLFAFIIIGGFIVYKASK